MLRTTPSIRRACLLIGLTLPTLAGSVLGDEPAVLVPPVDEITLLDPGTNSEGKPRPIVFPGADGQQRVDIPPTVIVHNFYYTGERDFRGPILSGGPSIVVVAHPVTSERLYLDVQMLPGSPRIVYRRNYIDYQFATQRIRLRFHHPLRVHGRNLATVHYDDEDGSELLEATATAKGHVHDWVDRTGFPDAVQHVAHGTHNVLDTSADRIRDAGEFVVAPFVLLYNASPLSGLMSSSAEDRAAESRDAAVQRASRETDRADTWIRTLR
jgi:hypothetical protein